MTVQKYKGPWCSRKRETSEERNKKVICTASKEIYNVLIRKLHDQYTIKTASDKIASDKISLLVFYSLKTFYCMPPSEKKNQSCLWINWFTCKLILKPHVLLKSINGYRSSMKLAPHKSLTAYLKQMKTGEKFDEMRNAWKEGKRIACTRTTRTNHSKPLNKIVATLSETGDK